MTAKLRLKPPSYYAEQAEKRVFESEAGGQKDEPRNRRIARAQVYATLALAAATAGVPEEQEIEP